LFCEGYGGELATVEELKRTEVMSLIDSISSLSSSDVEKIRDEDVLRYVAKYSSNSASRKRAVSELVKMENDPVLEYLAVTSNFSETRKSAIRGLSRLSNVEALRRIILSGTKNAVQEACSGLVRNMDIIIKNHDFESLELLLKFSKNARHRKIAENWLGKMRLVKMIKKIEA
jgi:hypothetical protein